MNVNSYTDLLPRREDITNALGLGMAARSSMSILPAVELFAAGVLVGAGLALLFAPKAGADLRQEIGERMSDVREKVSERVSSVANKAESAVRDTSRPI
jgi:hypothetical protein